MIEFMKNCACGKKHVSSISRIITGKGVLVQLTDVLSGFKSKKPYIIADDNTFAAAGKAVLALLDNKNTDYVKYIFKAEDLHCDESAVGSAIMHFDNSCDVIIGIGSGTINDICKIVSYVSGRPYIIICTAPSMDGYASATSSAIRDNLKISLQSRCPDVIIGDTDVVKTAPDDMLRAEEVREDVTEFFVVFYDQNVNQIGVPPLFSML